jgi:ATP-binding cassette subfamily B protein
MAISPHDEQPLGDARETYLVRRLLRYLKPYSKLAAAAVVLTFLNAPLMLIAPPLTKAAVDLFIVPDATRPPAGYAALLKRGADALNLGSNPYRGLLFIGLVFLVANMLGFVVQYAHGMIIQKMGQYVMFDLRQEIFTHFFRLAMRFHDRTPVGRLMTRLTSDVDALNEMFTVGIVSLVRNVIAILYIVAWMFYVNWRLTLLTFTALPLMAALTVWFRKGVRAATSEIRTQVAHLNAFLQEHISGMVVVQLFNREPHEQKIFEGINDAFRKANIRAVLYYAIFLPAVEVVGVVGIALILWKGGMQVISGMASLGTFIAFIQLTQSFYAPITDISEKYNILQSAIASSERIFALLDEPADVKCPSSPRQLGKARGKIEFRHVWFAYDDEDWVLKDVSFTVEAGERVAIVGHTGAGKTTITNLLLRFYEIQRGQILFDDQDLSDLDPTELRSNFGMVLQDVFLFSGDVSSNIRLGNQAIDDERVQAAAKAVNLDTLVRRLPEAYATQVQERGAGFSVGQKQLISFARALAFNPRVLILDEATSSVDTETEFLIRDAVERLMKGRTSLVIAHRLSTVQSADRIIVMHKGEVREIGTHQELLAAQGLYKRLYELQFSANHESSRVLAAPFLA